MISLKDIKPGDWIFLHGEMGAGKTYFTQELCKKLGVTDAVTSPTFALMHVYDSTDSSIKKVLHLDLYRLKKPSEICSLGLEQEFEPKDTIAFIEWPSLVDDSSWESFFKLTGCPKPNRIHQVHVKPFSAH